MSSGFLILIVLVFAVMWLLVIRPQRRKQMEQQRLLDRLAPGVEILTAGGLYGVIRAVGDDEVRLEIAPGTEVRIAKRAIAAVMPSDSGEPELEELEQAQRKAEEEALAGRDVGER